MNLSAMIFLVTVLLVFVVLDIVVLISLIKPGDERNQMIVWKASAYTLSIVIGMLVIDIVTSFIWAQSLSTNSFVMLEVVAIIYFITLMYEKKRHSV